MSATRRLTWSTPRRQCAATDSRQFASGGSQTRTTVGDSGMTVSISPGPWWLNPLWSLRQQVLVSRIVSEETGARHGTSAACAAT